MWSFVSIAESDIVFIVAKQVSFLNECRWVLCNFVKRLSKIAIFTCNCRNQRHFVGSKFWVSYFKYVYYYHIIFYIYMSKWYVRFSIF